MVSYESIYPGTTYLLDPSYNFMGYRVPVGEMGGTTSIQTSNQLKEVSKLLNQGMKTTEVSVINPEVFEMMPKGHLNEIKRLNELTGAESTLHAPLIEPSGITQQGWSEQNRESAEEQFKTIIARAQELSPKGNMPVTVHASHELPGTELIPEQKKGKGPEIGRLVVIDQQTGKPTALERDYTYFPEETNLEGKKAKGQIFDPERRLKMVNTSQWRNNIREIDFYKKEADEIIRRVQPQLIPYLEKVSKGEKITTEEQEYYQPALKELDRAERFLENVQMSLQNTFEKAARFSELDDPLLRNPQTGEGIKDPKTGKVVKVRDYLKVIQRKWNKNSEEEFNLQYNNPQEYRKRKPEIILKQSQLFDETLEGFGSIPIPQQFVPIEKFTNEKSSETLANTALHAYEKYGEKAPILSVENPLYGYALSSGKELKELIQKTRKNFQDKLIKQGKSKKEAEAAAKRLIGATWDTSHISMMRKQGFGPEQITKETKEIAPFVKHLHYNDNFGSTHTDLPPGMGNLPMKDILEELKKGGFKGKRIFEGGNFFQHFQTSPFIYTLESGGSPIYSGMAGPFWNQAMASFGPYYGGHGTINPSIHHQTYGAGFHTLPMELGGEIPGGGSRMSGTPNQ